MAEDAEVGSRTSSTTRSAKNLSALGTWLRMLRLVAMVMVVIIKWLKDHLFSKKPNVPMEYLTPLRSNADNISFKERWVSFNSFWPLLKLSVKGTIGKAIKQSSCWATQGSHPNQSLQKLTLHRYNKLSSRQVRGTYELSWYHSTSIIKLRLLGTSTPFSGTSFSSLTSPHKCSSGNTQLYDVYLIGSLAAKRTPSHSCVGSAIRFEPSQPTKTSTRPETWGPTRPEDIKVLRC